jgi:hypothetical protein
MQLQNLFLACLGSQLRASVVEYVPLFKTVPVNASEARAIIGTNLAGYEALLLEAVAAGPT